MDRQRWIALLIAGLIVVHVVIGLLVIGEQPTSAVPGASPTASPTASSTASEHTPPTGANRRTPSAQEAVPVEVPLVGELSHARAEVSAMAWHRQDAILLPQYPGRLRDGGAAAFGIARSELERWLDGDRGQPIRPRRIAFDSGGLEHTVEGFEGFEALAFDGDEVFVLVETNTLDGPQGHLFQGRISPSGGIVLDRASGRPLRAQTPHANTSYEALVVVGDGVLALFELNGGENTGAFGLLVGGGESAGSRVMPWAKPLQFRLTDATAADPQGRFWVSNVFWPGDGRPRQSCTLFERHGMGQTHAVARSVERLVEVQLRDGRLQPTDRAPVLLHLDGADTRNWEGALRLGERGFLLVTDEHPRTILAFVPAPAAP